MTIDQQLQEAKRFHYDRITVDTESLRSRVLSEVHSVLGKPVRAKKKRQNYALFAIPTAVLLLSGFSYEVFIKGTMLKQTPTIANAISEAPFPVRLPKYMPVHPVNEWGQVSYYGSNSPSNFDITLVWAGAWRGKGATVEEDVALTSGGIIRIPKHQPTVHLANGKPAIFAERSGSLFWTTGDETYRLTLHPWDVMPVSELIKIADSVK